MGFFQEFMQQLVNGFSLGFIYALIALGYTMVYGIAKLINFAHGEILMFGAFVGFFVLTAVIITPGTFLLSFVIAMAFCAILGVIIERTCYKPLRSAPRINTLITAIGVSLFLKNGARVFPPIGPNPKQFPVLPNKLELNLAGVHINQTQIIIFIVSLGLMLALNYIVNQTKIGKAMRAVSYDLGRRLFNGN